MIAVTDVFWYRARWTLRQVDGDSLEVLLDHGARIHSTQRVRLLDVYAPERNEAGGTDCTNELAAWLMSHAGYGHWPLLVHTLHDKRSFDRYIADVFDAISGDSLNAHMRNFIAERGYAGGTGA